MNESLWQNAIALACVATAAGYLARRLVRWIGGRSNGACHGCSGCSTTQASGQPFVTIESLTASGSSRANAGSRFGN